MMPGTGFFSSLASMLQGTPGGNLGNAVGLPPGMKNMMGAAAPPAGSTPSSFTSPPVDPQLLAALATLSQQSQQGAVGGMPSALPPGATVAPGAQLPAGGAPGQPGQPSPLNNTGQQSDPSGMSQLSQALMKLDPNALKAMLARMGMGTGAQVQSRPVTALSPMNIQTPQF